MLAASCEGLWALRLLNLAIILTKKLLATSAVPPLSRMIKFRAEVESCGSFASRKGGDTWDGLQNNIRLSGPDVQWPRGSTMRPPMWDRTFRFWRKGAYQAHSAPELYACARNTTCFIQDLFKPQTTTFILRSWAVPIATVFDVWFCWTSTAKSMALESVARRIFMVRHAAGQLQRVQNF